MSARAVLVLEADANDDVKMLANDIVKWSIFGSKLEIALVIAKSAETKNRYNKQFPDEYLGIQMAHDFSLQKMSLELVEWLRLDNEAQRGIAWPKCGKSRADEVLIVACCELEYKRKKKDKDERAAAIDQSLYTVPEYIIWISNDAVIVPEDDEDTKKSFRKSVSKLAKECIQMHGFFFGEEAKPLAWAAKKTNGSSSHGDLDHLRRAVRHLCASIAQKAVPASQHVEFILGPNIALRCKSTARIRRCSTTPARKSESLISARRALQEEEDNELLGEIDDEYDSFEQPKQDKIITVQRYYVNHNEDDDFIEKEDIIHKKLSAGEKIKQRGNTGAVSQRMICRAYEYGGKTEAASLVNGDGKWSLCEPADYAKTNAFPESGQPSSSRTKTGIAPKVLYRLVVLGAYPRHVVLDTSRLIEPDGERILTSADSRACTALTALCNSLRSQERGLIGRLTKPATQPHIKPTDKLVGLAPLRTTHDDTYAEVLVLRPLPWSDQTICYEGPLQSLFARETVQGSERRRRYLQVEDDDSIPAAAKRLRYAAEDIVNRQQMDPENIRSVLVSLADDHRERCWEYLRRIAAPKFHPPEPRIEDAVPESRFQLNVADALYTLGDLDALQVPNYDFLNALTPILAEAQRKRDLANDSKAFNFRHAVLTKVTDTTTTHDQASDIIIPVDNRLPALISSLAPVKDFKTQLTACSSDTRAVQDLFSAMQERIRDFIDEAKEDDPEYFEIAADCLLALRDAAFHHDDIEKTHSASFLAFAQSYVHPTEDQFEAFKKALSMRGLGCDN